MRSNRQTVVRKQVARFRGHEIDTAGDGFLAAFDGPGPRVIPRFDMEVPPR